MARNRILRAREALLLLAPIRNILRPGAAERADDNWKLPANMALKSAVVAQDLGPLLDATPEVKRIVIDRIDGLAVAVSRSPHEIIGRLPRGGDDRRLLSEALNALLSTGWRPSALERGFLPPPDVCGASSEQSRHPEGNPEDDLQ